MKKIITIAMAVLMLIGTTGQSVYALDAAPSMGGYTQDANGLSQCYSDYIEYYLFGISADTRKLITEEVRAGYEQGTIGMMALMPAYANLRKAGQIAEATANQVNGTAPTIDVIKQYYTLSDTQKETFAAYISSALSAINLTSKITDGVIKIQKAGVDFAEIKLVTEKPLSTTRIYLNAYLPGLTEDEKNMVEEMISEYSAAGGSPAGSGAVWRCIREIGNLMGVEATNSVDMTAGVVVVTVTKTGETYLKNCSAQIQQQAIAKAQEAFTAINFTSAYQDGVFTVTKDGVVRFTHRVLAIQETVSNNNNSQEADNSTIANDVLSESISNVDLSVSNETVNSSPQTGDSSNAALYLGGILATLAALYLLKKKILKISHQ